jgi:ABC-type polar amino acid transport system ATPase subunit
MANKSAESPGLAIHITSLKKRHGDREILRGVDLRIHPGQTVALIGPSGGGKTTLLRCLNGLEVFDHGSVRVGDCTLNALSGQSIEIARIRRSLGMIFQDFQLFPHLTVLENVAAAPIWVLGENAKEARDRSIHLLDRVKLSEFANRKPMQLSGGQKQRVAIARALALKPRGLLCDEITSALDPETKHEVLAVLEDLKRDGLTVIMVTHEIGFAKRAADRVVLLAEGNIAEEGTAAEVIDSPKTERACKFLARVLG